ncbi:MAG: amidohydrolase family protein [Candidatus Binataceae bacterium]
MSGTSKTADIRARLKHPVIDSDGHFTEYGPLLVEYIAKAGGKEAVKDFAAATNKTFVSMEWHGLSPGERKEVWSKRPPFYALPAANTLDLATSLFPDLLYERLDEIGLDFAVLYPGAAIGVQTFFEDDIRRLACRALNNYYADLFMDHPDRMTPVAVIPMHTPQEAIDELDYAVGERGMRVVMLPSTIRRPIPAIAKKYTELGRYAFRLDTYGIDSEYDYDPVWAKCLELKVVPTFHGPGEGWGSRTSISNYVYNHMGHFASANDAVCKSLFLDGVTRRFPQLKFLFLEGGVGWGRSLLGDIKGHWEKRNRDAVYNYDPRRIDREQFSGLYHRYGGKMIRDLPPGTEATVLLSRPEDPANVDDFANCKIESKQDIRDLFVPPFYFGCEADDPITSSAFDTKRNPFKARFNVVFGSDIGHFDVPDMRDVLPEAYEMVEEEMITEDEFKDFVFTNAVKLWTAVNPDFFKGTVVEDAAKKAMAAG